jgi:hypothetical protein
MRRSQQVMRLLCGYVTAMHFYAYFYVVQKTELTALVSQAILFNARATALLRVTIMKRIARGAAALAALGVGLTLRHRRCWPSRPDPRKWWPSRLVATAEED